MVAIGLYDAKSFFFKIFQQFVSRKGPPERQLRLEIYSQIISGLEGGLWRAPGVETDVVDPIVGAFAEVFRP